MSATPTPSVSSGQTCYFDTLSMQFTSPVNDSAGEMPESRSADPLPAASGSLNDIGPSSHVEGVDSPIKHTDDGPRQKTPSLRSTPPELEKQEQQASGIKTTTSEASIVSGAKEPIRERRSTHSIGTSPALANGGPPTVPNAEPVVDQNLLARSAKAERSLSRKQKDRIAKGEEDTKRFSKLLRLESSTEKVALDSGLKSLSSLQSLHKEAIKQERKAQVSHARAFSIAQKAESKFHEEEAQLAEVRAHAEARCMEERARWEGKQGEARAQQDRLDATKETIKEVESRIAECARKVERLRIVKATDEREKEAKLAELAGQK